MFRKSDGWFSARAVIACLLSGFLAVPPASAGTATNWLGGSTGLWSNSGSWDNGLPNGNFDVFVNNPGDLVTVDISPFISSLTTNPGTTVAASGTTLTIQSEPGSSLILQNGGTINLTNSAQLTLDYSNAAVVSPVLVPAAINTGAISLDSTSTLVLNQGTGFNALALTGGGSIQLAGGTNTISGATGSEALTTDNQISGNGAINLGSLQLTSAGGLTASGGALSVASLQNYDGVALNLGSYNVSDMSTLQIGNSATGIGINNANITLNGSGQILNSDGMTDALNGTLNTNNGTLTLQNNASLTTAGLTNSGTVNIANGSTLTTGDFSSNMSGSTLTQGTYNVQGALSVSNTSAITTIGSGASLTLDLTNGQINDGMGNDLIVGSLTDNEGSLTLQHGMFAPTTFTNNGTLTVAAGANVKLSSLTNITPDASPATTTTLSSGSYVVQGTLQANVGSGISTIGAAASLTLADDGHFLAIPPSVGSSSGGAGAGRVMDAIAATLVENDGTLTFQDKRSYALTAGAGLTNTGTLNLISSNVLIANGLTNSGTVSVDSTSTLDVSGGSLYTGNTLSGGAYNIAGTLIVGTGDGALNAIGSGASLTLSGAGIIQDTTGTNVVDGNINANAGTLVLNQGAVLTTQANVDFSNDGGTLTVDGQNTTLNIGPTSGIGQIIPSNFINGAVGVNGVAGTVNVTNGGTLQMLGAFVNGQAGSMVNVTGADPTGLGSFISSFGLTNNGTINVGAGAGFNASGNTFTNLDMNGVLSGGGNYNVGGTLIVSGNIDSIGAGTTVTLDGNGVILNEPTGCSCGGVSNALGGLDFIAGTLNVANTIPPGNFLQVQSFAPASGTLTIQSTGVLNLGGGLNGIGAAAVVGDVVNNGAITLAGSATLTSGLTQITTGSDLFIAGNLTNAPVSDGMGGQVPGTGVINIGNQGFLQAGSLTNSGSVALTGGSELLITILQQRVHSQTLSDVLTNTGTITTDGSGNTISVNGGDVFNDTPGVITLATASDPTDGDLMELTGNFVNNGSLSIGAGDEVSVAGTYSGTGNTQVQGTLSAEEVDVDSGGTLTGTGTIDGEVVNDGTINPGGDPMPGILTIAGDYSQTGTLLLDFQGSDLGGFQWDELSISGQANLGGTLAVNLDPMFSATVGDIFDIVGAGTYSGDFASFNPGTFDNGLTFVEIRDTNGDVALEVESATPEPSTWLLLGSAIMAMGGLMYRRRRQESNHAA